VVALGLALLATVAILLASTWLTPPVATVSPCGGLCGQPAPPIRGQTLDGASFDLASLRGRPVIVNFWGPSCIPCRDEFPLFEAKLREHAGSGVAIVGVLMDDPEAPARDFVAAYGATWPTVVDPSGAIRSAYRAVARPQSYFIDPDGILRQIQVGEVTDADFERLFATIAPAASPASQ
jgi:cytochrome c biogenesis protein CcmG/thiol:disulfide interchange protein DsbE